MPMNNRLLRPRVTTHPEALAWQAAAVANGGTVTATELKAVDRLVKDIYAAGIRDRFYRLNPFVGGFLGSLVPLFRGQSISGTQFGNTTDANGNFVAGDYGLTTGLRKAANTNAFLNTGVNANTIAMNSVHYGVGLLATNTLGTPTRSAIGAYSGTNIAALVLRSTVVSANAATFGTDGTTAHTAGDNVGSSGTHLGVGNIVAAYPSMFRNGVASGATASATSDFPSAFPIYVFGLNLNNSSLFGPTDARLGWYSYGLTMTAAQALAFHNAITTFYAAIGRA